MGQFWVNAFILDRHALTCLAFPHETSLNTRIGGNALSKCLISISY